MQQLTLTSPGER